MALEAVVFAQDPFTYSCKDLYSLVAAWNHDDYGFHGEEEEKALVGLINNNTEQSDVLHATWDSNSSPEACTADQSFFSPAFPAAPAAASTGRRKRRRIKSAKNKEEIENQRMTHIAVERNRRKQMNEYLAVLRSLMPPSYVQRVSFKFQVLNFNSFFFFFVVVVEFSAN